MKVTTSSGNCFADMGLDNSDELQIKSKLVRNLYQIMASENLTQEILAERLGLEERKVEQVLEGQLDSFTIDELTGYLRGLGQEIEIAVQVLGQAAA